MKFPARAPANSAAYSSDAPPARRSLRRFRRGSVYLIVLSTMSVSLIAVTAGVLATRIHAGRASALADAALAARAAESGVEAALVSAQQGLVWRTAHDTTSPQAHLTVGSAAVDVYITDPVDGALRNDASQLVEIKAVATLGNARRIYTVRATPNPAPHASLAYAILAQGNIVMTSATIWSKLPIQSNGSVTASTSAVEAPVRAVGTVSGSTYTPAGSGGATAVTLPAIADVIAEYAMIGSSGTMSGSGATTLANEIISPVNAPWALATNASGVYVIDCQARRLTIENCRINATLILRNATAGVRITDSVIWDPPMAGYPALIADGALSITMSGDDVLESNKSKSFNPVGAPFEGSADSDLLDQYPSEIRGLIYCSGALSFSGAGSYTAPILVGGTATITSLTATFSGAAAAQGGPALRVASPQFLVNRSAWVRGVD